MSHRDQLVLIAALVGLLAPHTAHAQKDVASCKPVFDALEKKQATSYHAYTTMPTLAGGTPSQRELIAAGGQNYIQMNGEWKRSPMDQAAMAKQEQDNIRDAKALSCHRLREESVGGVSAIVYAQHSENEDTKSDGQVWIATATGLVVRTETDMSMVEGGDTRHMVTRYEYTNVQAPAGAR
jgi:hypothetical protein